MAIRKLTNAAYLATNWQDEVESKNDLKKGYCNASLEVDEATGAIILHAGSVIEMNGIIYKSDTNTTSTNVFLFEQFAYLFLKDTGGVMTTYISTTLPAYSILKKGYYSGLDRAFGMVRWNESILSYQSYDQLHGPSVFHQPTNFPSLALGYGATTALECINMSTGAGLTSSSSTGDSFISFSFASSKKAIIGKSWGTLSTGIDGNGTLWDFYASGTGGNYGPFTGSHEITLKTQDDILPGQIVSCTGKAISGESISATIPECVLSSKEKDSKVFGVYVQDFEEHVWCKEEARFAVVNALGDGHVLVCSEKGDIKAGDYITTGTSAGYGVLQDDDIVHSYTVAKAIEDVVWSEKEVSGYKTALVSCIYLTA